MKKRVTTTKKKKRTEKRQLPYEQNCNEVIHNGITYKLFEKTEKASKNIEAEYERAASRVAYMSIEDVLRNCPPPNTTLYNPGQMKAYTEKIEEWVLDNIDEPDRIRDMARTCQERNWNYGLRMLDAVYKKCR